MSTDAGVPPEVNRRGRLFWVSAAVGGAGIGWGLHGALVHSRDTRPANLASFFLGDVIVHDAIWAPVVLAGGVLVARVVPAGARAAVQAAAIVVGSVMLFAYPEIRGFAAIQHNPTSLPYDYGANAAGVAVGVCAAVALVAVGRHVLVARRASGNGPLRERQRAGVGHRHRGGVPPRRR